MPATSRSQQRLFCMALAVRKGDLKRSKVNKSVLDIVDGDMTNKEIEDFTVLKEMRSLRDCLMESIFDDEQTYVDKSGQVNFKELLKDENKFINWLKVNGLELDDKELLVSIHNHINNWPESVTKASYQYDLQTTSGEFKPYSGSFYKAIAFHIEHPRGDNQLFIFESNDNCVLCRIVQGPKFRKYDKLAKKWYDDFIDTLEQNGFKLNNKFKGKGLHTITLTYKKTF